MEPCHSGFRACHRRFVRHRRHPHRPSGQARPIRRPALPSVRLEQAQPRQPRRDGADDPADVARRHSRPGGRGLLPAARRKRHRPDHTEGTVVDDPVSTMSVDIPNFYGPALDGWLRVVDAVHEVGGKIMPQLWHVGMARNPAKAPHPELPSAGPSGLTMRGFPGLTQPGLQHSEPMTREHIRRVVEAFGQAAADAQRLGFDGVEIHGAHGYLIDQFFWAVTNQRADEYGGDLVSRTRFAVEIIEAVRRATGPDFPIILRFSQWKQQDYAARLATTPEELARFLAPLSTAGVDIFHCSQRRFWEPEFERSDLNLPCWTNKLTGKPTVTVGRGALPGDALGSLHGESSKATRIDDLLDPLARDHVDLFAGRRALLGHPAPPRQVQEARYDELLPFEPAALATLS